MTSIRWPNEPYAGWSAAREARRERIAMAALQGILSNPKENLTGVEYGWHAMEAVKYADALIKELEKAEEQG